MKPIDSYIIEKQSFLVKKHVGGQKIDITTTPERYVLIIFMYHKLAKYGITENISEFSDIIGIRKSERVSTKGLSQYIHKLYEEHYGDDEWTEGNSESINAVTKRSKPFVLLYSFNKLEDAVKNQTHLKETNSNYKNCKVSNYEETLELLQK